MVMPGKELGEGRIVARKPRRSGVVDYPIQAEGAVEGAVERHDGRGSTSYESIYDHIEGIDLPPATAIEWHNGRGSPIDPPIRGHTYQEEEVWDNMDVLLPGAEVPGGGWHYDSETGTISTLLAGTSFVKKEVYTSLRAALTRHLRNATPHPVPSLILYKETTNRYDEYAIQVLWVHDATSSAYTELIHTLTPSVVDPELYHRLDLHMGTTKLGFIPADTGGLLNRTLHEAWNDEHYLSTEVELLGALENVEAPSGKVRTPNALVGITLTYGVADARHMRMGRLSEMVADVVFR